MSENTERLNVQLIYAGFLRLLANLAITWLIIAFMIYLTGVRPLLVPKSQLPKYWHLTFQDYATVTSTPVGWQWIHNIGHSEVICLTGIIFISSVSILCCIRILPHLSRQKDIPFMTIVTVQIAVLLLAASGVLSLSGH